MRSDVEALRCPKCHIHHYARPRCPRCDYRYRYSPLVAVKDPEPPRSIEEEGEGGKIANSPVVVETTLGQAFGAAVWLFRVSQGQSQKDIANRMGYARPWITKIERDYHTDHDGHIIHHVVGRGRGRAIFVIERFAAALDIPVYDLIRVTEILQAYGIN